MNRTIVLAGSLAQKPHQAGHTWVFLQYLLGFRRLGWDVLFLDRLEPDMCVDAAGNRCSIEICTGFLYLKDVMTAFGLEDSFAVACDGGRRFIGLPREEVLNRVNESAALINVMGFFTDPEVLAKAGTRVFFDIDPGFGQMWRELGWHDPYAGYDRYVTIGERIGQADCTVPDCGLTWITTKQPVVLEYWPASEGPSDGAFTSIGAWRGPYGSVEYGGRTYGLRAHEFRKFMTLPTLSKETFEVALDIHSAETNDLALLSTNGWRLEDPSVAAHDPGAYQAYLSSSKAEFMVAKNMYVQSKSGWFSDRSICYLATGRPVLAEDTGLEDLSATGEGLVTFQTLDEAVAGAAEISRHYVHHSRRARQLAEQHFDSDIVLSRLLSQLGVS
jgi:hypothetical protein